MQWSYFRYIELNILLQLFPLFFKILFSVWPPAFFNLDWRLQLWFALYFCWTVQHCREAHKKYRTCHPWDIWNGRWIKFSWSCKPTPKTGQKWSIPYPCCLMGKDMPSLGENNVDFCFHGLYTWYLIVLKKRKKRPKKQEDLTHY